MLFTWKRQKISTNSVIRFLSFPTCNKYTINRDSISNCEVKRQEYVRNLIKDLRNSQEKEQIELYSVDIEGLKLKFQNQTTNTDQAILELLEKINTYQTWIYMWCSFIGYLDACEL